MFFFFFKYFLYFFVWYFRGNTYAPYFECCKLVVSILVLRTRCSAYFVSPLFNTPDSVHHLIRLELHELHRVCQIRDIQNVQCGGSQGPGLKTNAVKNMLLTNAPYKKFCSSLFSSLIVLSKTQYLD